MSFLLGDKKWGFLILEFILFTMEFSYAQKYIYYPQLYPHSS